MLAHTGFPSFVWSIYPPVSGEQPSGTGIRDLSTRKADSRPCHHDRWQALTLPSHPCPPSPRLDRRFFSSPLLCPHGHLPFQKYVALCCPDFPPLSCIRICIKRAMERSTAFYLLLNEPWLHQIHIHGMRHPEIKIPGISPAIPFLFAFSGFPVPPHVL
jgi:hypothetical protein